MDDKLPNQNNNPPASPTGGPPAFGSTFDPHSNPQDPNNPYQTYQPPPSQVPVPETPNQAEDNLKDPAQSEVAKHQARGPDGKFVSSEYTVNPEPTSTSASIPPSPSVPPESPKPESNFKKTIKFIVKIKWGRVSAYIVGFVGVASLLFSIPSVRNWIDSHFPSSSPLFGREASYQGVLKSSKDGLYTLVLPDHQAYTIHFKPSSSLSSLKKVNEAVVKGHLGWTPYVIEDAEIFPMNFTTDNSEPSPKTSQNTQTTPNTPNPSDSSNSSVALPPLYSSLTWEVTKTKTLIFTSGLRKIEQEGVYLESSQIETFPQDFINYYTNQLNNLGFKQTLDSKEPNGTTTTYSKEDTFLTFGVKNVFKGSGDAKQIIGYKAYIEHN